MSSRRPLTPAPPRRRGVEENQKGERGKRPRAPAGESRAVDWHSSREVTTTTHTLRHGLVSSPGRAPPAGSGQLSRPYPPPPARSAGWVRPCPLSASCWKLTPSLPNPRHVFAELRRNGSYGSNENPRGCSPVTWRVNCSFGSSPLGNCPEFTPQFGSIYFYQKFLELLGCLRSRM